MKTIIHKSESRGYANHGWLRSYHTFSFGNYFNPDRMNFGKLRVLNDDVVQPKMGFGTHPHQNMEIISIPIKGALSHKDSMGNKKAIEVGEVQVMSAGTGLTHSEFNDSKTDETNFLQLWILPEKQDVEPKYEQKKFNLENRVNKLQTIVTPQDKLIEGSLGIYQQAYISLGYFQEEKEITYSLKGNNGVYIFVINGTIKVNQEAIEKRDAIGIWDVSDVQISIKEDTEILLVEVPMN